MAQTLATPLFIDMSQLARCIFFAALVADLGAALSLGLASEHFADGSREMLAGIFVVWVAVLIPMAASSVEILHRLRGRRARPQAAVGRGAHRFSFLMTAPSLNHCLKSWDHYSPGDNQGFVGIHDGILTDRYQESLAEWAFWGQFDPTIAHHPLMIQSSAQIDRGDRSRPGLPEEFPSC